MACSVITEIDGSTVSIIFRMTASSKIIIDCSNVFPPGWKDVYIPLFASLETGMAMIESDMDARVDDLFAVNFGISLSPVRASHAGIGHWDKVLIAKLLADAVADFD